LSSYGRTERRPGTGVRKVTDEIIEQLRQDITTGRLAVGARLPSERDLAAQFRVSQPTIREVIRVLDAMGLVEVRHGSGAWVRGDAALFLRASLESVLQLGQVGLLEVLDVRGVLGRSSAALAATAATGEDIARLEAAYERLEDTAALRTFEELIEAIAGLQIAVCLAAHNPLQLVIEQILIELLLNLQIHALRQRGLRSWQRRAAGFQPDRRDIVDAIRERDPVRAGVAMSAYLEHQRELFLADKDLAALRLSDPRAVQVATQLRLAAP
jgi:GntR family transcriptional repressor for pyruvate dehydrogenase complex